jgi:hypothetical protein
VTSEQPDKIVASLALAYSDAEQRGAFYSTLMKSNVFIPGEIEREGKPVVGESTATGKESFKIIRWTKNDGSPVIPFFSSLTEMYKDAKMQGAPSVELSARNFFGSVKNTPFVLNPFGQWKEFHPDEIAMLLKGDLS